MPIPFLSSIGLNKNEVQDFKVFNLASDPTLTSGGDFGYFWLNTSGTKTLKFWDGANIRSLIDSTTISSSTAGTANDLSGGVAGSLPYQQGVGDTTFLGIGTADQVLTVNSGATAPQWLSQSSLSVGSATNKTGGNLGDILVQSGSGTTSFLSAGTAGQVITSNGASPQYVNQSTLSVGSATTATTATNVAGGANGSILVQSGAGTTGQLAIGASGYILTSNGTTPGWSASIPSTSVSGLAASATTDTTNASNISSGTLGLARLALATGQFYVGDGSNNPAATAKSSIPLSGFGAAGADVAMGGFKITGLADPAAATDAATRGYVDSVAQGLDVKASCLVATTADITLASPGAVTIDGIYSATDFTAGTTRILVKDQSAPAENGIYIWQGPAAAMTRSADADTWDELVGAFTFIERGTANADSGWVCTVNAGGTLGSTAVTWVKFSQAGSYTQGRGMVLDGTAFNFAQNTDYTANTIPYASGATTIGFIGAGTADQVLRVPGAGGTPAFGAIDLTKSAAVTGALPIANGGTGATSFTQGQVLFAGASAISSSSNLFWDNANNRLGIGTATPGYPLSVNGRISYIGAIGEGADTTLSSSSTGLLHGNSSYWTEHRFYASGNEQHRIAQSGVFTWYDGAGGTRMTLNGTGLGVGVSPNTILHVRKDFAGYTTIKAENQHTIAAGTGISFTINDGGTDASWFRRHRDGTGNTDIGYNAALRFRGQVTATERTDMLIDTSGNVGIGTTTPGARLDINAGTNLNLAVGGLTLDNFTNDGVGITFSRTTDDGDLMALGVCDTNKLGLFSREGLIFATGGAALYGQTSEKMRLDASGNLGLGVTPSAWAGGGNINLTNAAGIVSAGTSVNIGANYYYGNSSFRYVGNGRASLMGQDGGAFTWYNAANNTSGAGVSFSLNTLMVLDASGNLLVNRASTIGTNSKLNVQLHGTSASTYSAPSNAAISVDAGTNDNCVIALVGGGDQGIYRANSSGAYDVGISLGSNAERRIQFTTAATTRLSIKSTGQVNFVGQASDPAGAAGDVVYNSTSNRLKYHNGTAWVNTGTNKYSGALAGTGTSFTVTHNLGTRDVTVAVRKSGSTYDQVFTDVQMTDTNTVTIIFASSVTGSDYTVTVIG